MSKDVLIVDDEAAIREVVAALLQDEGYKPRQAANSDQAFSEIDKRVPDIVLLDIWLEGSKLDGIEILERVRQQWPVIPVVIFSGHGTIEMAVQAIKNGAYDFIEKPFKTDRLLLTMQRALEISKLKRENEQLKIKGGDEIDLLGTSPAIVRVRQAIDRVAPTNSRVLISGPPGSGKEIASRMIHAHSRRADAAFVVLNCAVMAPERLEVELFGAEANGDTPRAVGILERANGGTLFLDEVADMPLETQGRMLRVLQENRFSRPGRTERIDLDIRVIASTNRDLTQLMSQGKFREELYYRLNVVPVQIPALSERRIDIPLLARTFMDRAARSASVPPRVIGDDAMAVMQSAEWPGNVRQLRNAVEWMLIMAPGDPKQPIGVDGLPPDLTNSAVGAMDPTSNGELVAMPLREAREHFERAYLQAQLERFGGNISRTANFVGMERSALHRKLKTLGLHSGDD
ncbi:MAG TPA: sigma-54 dependent transcriptional regulator [Geminicoccus sp.]|jgi:two-component system nitrogen regulation response regulator NtrX|uniref:nitrogen assimilation response regulator NtrX n=1 Tax=Geminicoccus sp. TaxID=2024832 RepID=UPI002E2FF4A8|nr:sigma-54 dependent transcriptional regulator [Geminicoccus sp.]HEX2527808.1 sigma-54 dependent transcriptional regulator [Geminicoccus sp.]